MENKILEKALEYIGRKISVIPVGRDKVPLVKWEEFQARYPTKEEVIGWWEKWPEANVAIVTGKISGLTIIDVEAGGDISQFPKTATVQSGGGGWHLYYAYHPIKSTNRILPLTDIKSDGGLCTAPPSIHASGKEYVPLTKINCLPFPAELFGEVQHKNRKDLSKLLNETISQGDRNNTATSVCGKLLLRFKEQEWETQAWPLFRAWNETHNQPPLPNQELLTIYKSISEAEQRREKSGADVGEAQLINENDIIVVTVPIKDGFAVFKFEDIDYTARNIDALVRCFLDVPASTQRTFTMRLNVLSGSARESFARQLKDSFGKETPWPLVFSQACTKLEQGIKSQSVLEKYTGESATETKYLIKPFIEEGVPNIIFGKGGSGKSYLAMDMALSLATEKPFIGIKPEKIINTLFVDYESTSGIYNQRMKKLIAGNTEYEELAKQKLSYYATKGVPIHDLTHRLIEMIRQNQIELIIIDSAALACGGEPERAEKTTQFF